MKSLTRHTIIVNASEGAISKDGLNWMASICRDAADSWYYDPATGERKIMNDGERMMLMTSEIVEAFEGVRKNKMDDHLPHRRSVEVELADAIIRILDYAGENALDVEGAFWEKLAYNMNRADHKPENRVLEDGKKF